MLLGVSSVYKDPPKNDLFGFHSPRRVRQSWTRQTHEAHRVLLERLTGPRHESGGAVPALAQLTVSSYHAALASSHSSASQVTMHKVTHSQEAQAIGRMQPEKNAHSRTS
eukprot:TRINITY_DN4618_c0_g1_i2.p1 TRINITY_DN4618_c0_g1~~TRINITY_DN4618_c0_g1_i2.p1  ORF type:complete len:110 (+),score=4.92 TRINITY_DN4618_c0_g1_i2:57-386(+)